MGDLFSEAAGRRLGASAPLAQRLRPTTLAVDLLHVTFIDSTGIGALAGAADVAHQHGVGFTVRNPSPFVATQLRTTGLYETLTADR